MVYGLGICSKLILYQIIWSSPFILALPFLKANMSGIDHCRQGKRSVVFLGDLILCKVKSSDTDYGI